MKELDYMINPVIMGGLVKKAGEDGIKVNLHGRLGVITIKKPLVMGNVRPSAGDELKFYFSYLKVNITPYDYDSGPLLADRLFAPCLIGGIITEVNDTAIQADIMEDIGTVAVPRRWVFTDWELKAGQNVEFYLSPMKIISTTKRMEKQTSER